MFPSFPKGEIEEVEINPLDYAKIQKKKSEILIFFCLLFTAFCFLPFVSEAEIVDRIAATVNDEVITLSELKERAAGEKRDEKEVLEGMINRILILSEARRLGIGGTGEVGIDPYQDENLIINRFIERRIKAFVLIPIEKAREFYEKNKEGFKGKDFSEVRDDINLYLIEEETNRRLKEFLIEAKKKADIRRKL